jgi:MFS family permease
VKRFPVRSIIRPAYGAFTRLFGSNHQVAKILASEGVLFTLIFTLCNNNNNLYASRLGATSFDLGLIASLPPIVGMICLIPFAVITDRLRNKRNMVVTAALGLGIMYVLVGAVAFLKTDRILPLIIMLVLVNFPMSLYQSSWQSFFSDVAPRALRNEIYAHRTKMNTVVGIIFPLLFGLILTAASGSGKIVVHQIYYFLAFPLAIGQVLLLRKIPGCGREKSDKFSMAILKRTVSSLLHSKPFMGFLGVALLVYCGWEMDWSLYFQAQLHYLNLNEAQMSLIAVLCAITQFIMLGVWSRIASVKGVRFVFMIGAGGFAFCCLTMVIALLLPREAGLLFYYVFQSVGSSAFSAFQFSLLLCLLEMIPNRNKTLSIAIYSSAILLSNSIMPFLGVYIYNIFGENRSAMILTLTIVTGVRILATALAGIRWYANRNLVMDESPEQQT